MTYYNVCFPQLEKVLSKLALTTTIISGSTATGELLPPHFQFQTLVQTAKNGAIWIETVHYMLNVQGTFGHEAKQSFSILLGIKNKEGWMTKICFSKKKLIMKLFPNTAPVKGQWIILKCDSSLGRLIRTSWYFRSSMALFFTLASPTWMSAVWSNLQLIIDKHIATNKTRTLLFWCCVTHILLEETKRTGLDRNMWTRVCPHNYLSWLLSHLIRSWANRLALTIICISDPM